MGKKEVFQPASVGKDSFFFLYCYKLDGFFITFEVDSICKRIFIT